MRGIRRRKQFLPSALITFIAGLIVTALLVVSTVYLDAEYNRDVAYRTTQVYSARIESLLDSLFHKTDVLEAIIIADGGVLSERTFTDVAKSLVTGDGIRAIQYQPGGTAQYVYPLAGNENTLGTNVFDNPTRRDDALLAVETNQVTLSGPYELKQGGLGLVARDPIYITNGAGQDEFWGFATIILDLPQALDPIMLDDLAKDGYRFELSSTSSSGDLVKVASSEQLPGDDAVSYRVSVPNNDWTLKLSLDGGWARILPLIVLTTVGILISLLLAIVVRLVRIRRFMLHELATTDELTGLSNRRWVSQEIDRWCAGSDKIPFAILFLDLDKFKAVNDTMGHKCGDELLKEIAARLVAICREGDVLARLGGDEFVVARRNSDREDARVFAEKLRQTIARPIATGDREWVMLASIGIALFPEDGTDYDTLTHVADIGMYYQKRSEGGACRTDR